MKVEVGDVVKTRKEPSIWLSDVDYKDQIGIVVEILQDQGFPFWVFFPCFNKKCCLAKFEFKKLEKKI